MARVEPHLTPRELELVARKPDQVRRFRRLRRRFGALHSRARRHPAPGLVEPEWRERNRALELDIAPEPPLDFLRHPVIRYSMIVGDRFAAHELPALEGALSRRELATAVEEDPVGRPFVLDRAPCPTSANAVHQLHHLVRFRELAGVDPRRLGSVVEWGGGYGRLAATFLRLHGGAPTYTIVDTPPFSSLQWLYLSALLGPGRVQLVASRRAPPRPGRVNLMPVGLADLVPAGADLFVSMWALNESSTEAQELVVARRWLGARHLLMGMHRVPLASRAEADGAVGVPAGDFMPGQLYLVR